jgi:hypothetical protein
MRTVIAVAAFLSVLQASAQDQKVVAVWEGYEYRTSDWAHCQRLLKSRLAADDFRSPFCEYQHIGELLRDGWIVNHSVRIETPVRSTGTMVDGCYLFELKCVGRRYFMTRDSAYRPPAPPVPQLKHIQVPEALGKDSSRQPAAPE